MSKIIIFCADGTWNGPSEPNAENPTAPPTNVFKLFANLAGKDLTGSLMLGEEQERALVDADGTVLQHAKYLHGVGDSSNYLVRLVGGTTGAGLIVRVIRGYTFISRNYEPGDRIFITGFSRGAYTARAIGGMIASQGLLDASKLDLDDRENAYRLGAAVWYSYLRAAKSSRPVLLGGLQRYVLELPGFFSSVPPSTDLIKAPIDTVAVWDTVGALGIPAFNMQLSRIDLLQFADTKLSPVVKHGLHAVSIDERRADFTPTLWDPDPRIVQALFPGCHADVGGGFAAQECGLSDCSLSWMMSRLTELGVMFAADPTFAVDASPIGPGHQPWTSPPWSVLPQAPRIFPAGLAISRCAVDRLAYGSVCAFPGALAAAWCPTNLSGYLVDNAPATGVDIV
jgi:glutathione S-transferase